MKNILVALDFSSSTQSVVDAACRIGRIEGATLHFLHVVEPMPDYIGYDAAGVIPAPAIDPQKNFSQETAANNLEKTANSIKSRGLTVSAELATGIPASAIIAKAKELPASLIVMGSHGHGSLYHLLVGSVTEGVLKHTPCPVLIVPLRKDD